MDNWLGMTIGDIDYRGYDWSSAITDQTGTFASIVSSTALLESGVVEIQKQEMRDNVQIVYLKAIQASVAIIIISVYLSDGRKIDNRVKLSLE